MNVITTTPFGQRPVSAVLMKQLAQIDRAETLQEIEKWTVFDDLCVAGRDFGVSDRDLAVLHGLLGFFPGQVLADDEKLIVFPSNAALSQRLHGMAESTLRRHLAALVQAGLIRRHDSPNGKRYARRDQGGQVVRAFGFDLRPLLERAEEIKTMAAEKRAANHALRGLREEVVVAKRDAVKLLAYAKEHAATECWDEIEDGLMLLHRALRRKSVYEELEQALSTLQGFLDKLHSALSETKEMSANDVNSERHYSDSKTDSYESELSKECGKGAQGREDEADVPIGSNDAPNIPLALVLKACPDILPYADREMRHWHELVATAAYVRSMMGISADCWQQAVKVMGSEVAAVCVAGILQRVADIRSPGGYLRALTGKAAEGAFSPGPMIMALLR